jgi:hypothetical protein
MKRLFAAIIMQFALVGVAFCQSPPFPSSLPPNTVVGRISPVAGPASAIPLATLQQQLSLGWTNVLVAKTGNYTVANQDCGSTIGLSGGTFYTLTIGAVGTYRSTCVLNVINQDSTRGKLMSINGIPPFILWPLMTMVVYSDGTSWQTFRNVRWKLFSPVTFHVNGTSGVDYPANDCLGTGSSACASIQAPVSAICSEVDAVNTFKVTVKIDTVGVTYGPVQLCPVQGGPQGGGPPSGGIDPSIVGDTTTPSNVVIDGGNTYAIQSAGQGIEWYIEGLTLGASGTGIPIIADAGTWIRMGVMRFAPSGSGVSIKPSARGIVEAQGNVTIATGAAGAFVFSQNQGLYLSAGVITYTLVGSPTFSIGFANCDTMSEQVWDGAIFSGSAGTSSPRISALNGCGIHTGSSASTTFFPGDSFTPATAPAWYN